MLSEDDVLDKLKNVYDPEIMVDIVDLGLVYDIEINNKTVNLKLTLTSPGCPAGDIIESESKAWVKQLQGIKKVNVEFVWDPPWRPAMMSDEAKIELGYAI